MPLTTAADSLKARLVPPVCFYWGGDEEGLPSCKAMQFARQQACRTTNACTKLLNCVRNELKRICGEICRCVEDQHLAASFWCSLKLHTLSISPNLSVKTQDCSAGLSKSHILSTTLSNVLGANPTDIVMLTYSSQSF